MAGGELAGTVTFLLTDIVGSTQLWEQHGVSMAAAMVVHDGVIDEVVARCGGVVRPRGEGDSRFAVFGRTSDAAAAAVRIVAGLRELAWVTAEPVRVRVGLRTGEAETRDGDYYGTAVNLCARLRGLAHPAQVLMSETTARLVRATPPAGVSVSEVGVHRLKGLSIPERVFQLCHDDIDDDFPALARRQPARTGSRAYRGWTSRRRKWARHRGRASVHDRHRDLRNNPHSGMPCGSRGRSRRLRDSAR